MLDLLVATKNPGKFREISEVLNGLELRLRFLGEMGDYDDSDFVEDGDTFQSNARKKAEFYYELFDRKWPTLGEDSGILVDALQGELGVKTRRWGAGERASDQEWIEYFMERMSSVPGSERGAKFVCSACLLGMGDSSFQVEGETRGVITERLEAEIASGIPLSSCFRPEGFDRVYQALSVEEKNAISHRGKAMQKLRDFLADQ